MLAAHSLCTLGLPVLPLFPSLPSLSCLLYHSQGQPCSFLLISLADFLFGALSSGCLKYQIPFAQTPVSKQVKVLTFELLLSSSW